MAAGAALLLGPEPEKLDHFAVVELTQVRPSQRRRSEFLGAASSLQSGNSSSELGEGAGGS